MPEEKWIPNGNLHPEGSELCSYPVVDLQRAPAGSSAPLRAYLNILSRRRWSILTVALVVTTLVAIFSYKEKPVYRATAGVEVDSETPDIQSVNNLSRPVPNDPTFLQTQVDVLNSSKLAWQTIQQLKLDRRLAFNPLVSGPAGGSEEPLAVRKERLVRRFKGSLDVELASGSRMIEVSFESTNPQLAAEAANTLVSNYREYNFLTKYDATRQVSGWMSEQLNELKSKVEHSQQALVDYQKENSILNVNGKENIENQRLAAMSQDLTIAQNNLARQQSLYDLVKAHPRKVGLLAQDDLLQSLEEKYADLKTAYVDALGRYGPKFPKVARLHGQINQIQSLMQQERSRALGRISHNYQASLGRVKLLSKSVAHEKAAVGKLNQLMIQYDLLKHDFDTNQQLYDNLLTRVKDATVSAGLRANNVHLVDPAMEPSSPVRPRKGRNTAIGLMVGLILGTTLAFLREALDTSIKTAEDIEDIIAEPVLGVIPAARSLGHGWLLHPAGIRRTAASSKVEWAVLKHPASALADSYHALRTAVLLASVPRSPQAVLVTSAQPYEGKTSTAFNLATGLARLGKRVLFVDADMRQAGLERLIDTNGRPGLSSVLAGEGQLDEAMFQAPDLPALWFLGAGLRPPNPADLLASQPMEDLLAGLRGRFDHIVVDAPPVLMVTDATVLSAIVDSVILVAESQVTAGAALARTHRILSQSGANILGCVLNKLDLKHDGYYGSYYRRHSRHYTRNLHAQETSTRSPAVEPVRTAGAEGT